MPMMSVYLPYPGEIVMKYVGIANLEIELASKLFLWHIDEEQFIDREPINYRFENQGYESTAML